MPAPEGLESPRPPLPQEQPLLDVLVADARLAAAYRGAPIEPRSQRDQALAVLRLMFQSEPFFALAAYRARMRLKARGVPVLPWMLKRFAMRTAQISIADTVIVQPGVIIPSGQVVVEGTTEIGPFVTLQPWVTIAPVSGGSVGPKVGPGAIVNSGAKILGEIELGAGARVGTNAVVLDDVPPNTTVVGIPAQAVAD